MPGSPTNIIQQLNARQPQGYVSTEPLTQTFDVTPQTIRRDLNDLCDHQRLKRYHAGAGLSSWARALQDHTELRIITNTRYGTSTLSANPGLEVIVTGGEKRTWADWKTYRS